MGLDYQFYVQKRTAEGWQVPPGFANGQGEREEFGGFAWIDDKASARDLFCGTKALFPLRSEVPPEITNTLLFQRCGAAFWEWYHGWLPFEDLLLDLWDEPDLLICKRVEARYANLFGDGRQSFPRRGLLSAGVAPVEVEGLEGAAPFAFDAELVADPIDRERGKKRFELERVGPDFLVEVTWKASVRSFLGDWCAKEFRNLRRYGRDEELRVICLVC